MLKFDFGTVILHKLTSMKTPLEFAKYLDETWQQLNYPRGTLFIKKGDVLIWHGALAHGGSIITNPNQTRKSFVCHYSRMQGLPYHRNSIHTTPVSQDYNGVAIYNNPLLPQSAAVFSSKTYTW
jgi:phytanoyl-CoA hydroxylase